jgi:alkylation response protein AidB-like acyl-CoA dehydrogenase
VPYLVTYGTEEQKQRWLPGMARGERIGAIAMSEPGTGSDLAGICTSARRTTDRYVLNGSKTFISNGILADVVLVVARTDSSEPHKGLSILVVERGMPGFERGRNLDKIGMHAQDTAELHFTDVDVPAENLLGEEGGGFGYLVHNLAQERLIVAVLGIARARAVFEQTRTYCLERTAFGQPIGTFQANRFTLAELATKLEVTQAFVDRCIELHCDGRLSPAEAAMTKWWTSDIENQVIDRCLQLHGGYGYMEEYAVARAFRDARVQSIHAGTNEIMKEIIGRSLGFG